MAEIFNFAEKAAAIKKKRESEEMSTDNSRVSAFDLKHLDNIMQLLIMEDPLKKKVRAMADITQQCSLSALAKAKEQIADYSRGELAAWIETSEQKDWLAKPAFFRAILEKYFREINL